MMKGEINMAKVLNAPALNIPVAKQDSAINKGVSVGVSWSKKF